MSNESSPIVVGHQFKVKSAVYFLSNIARTFVGIDWNGKGWFVSTQTTLFDDWYEAVEVAKIDCIKKYNREIR